MSQLDLLTDLEPVKPQTVPTGRQHRLVLMALFGAGSRGLTGEECAQRCGIRLATTATTRLEELAEDRDQFPVPLVWKSATKERATASGRLAHIWRLTDVGKSVAGALAEQTP